MESFDYLKSCLDAIWLAHRAYPARRLYQPARPGAARDRRRGAGLHHAFVLALLAARRRARQRGLCGRRHAGRFRQASTRKGKIVLLENIANPAATLRASQAGAVGQIHISPHEHLHEMCISVGLGQPGRGADRGLLPKTIVLSLRKDDGDALKARVQAGESGGGRAACRGRHGLAQDADPAGRPRCGRARSRRYLRHVLRPSRHLASTA